MTRQELIIESSDDGEVLVVTLIGSLDASRQRPLKEELDRLFLQRGDVILDFAQVSFIDSSCLGLLVAKARETREKKGDVKLSRLNDDVRSIFEITRLDRLFEIFDTIEDASASYYQS